MCRLSLFRSSFQSPMSPPLSWITFAAKSPLSLTLFFPFSRSLSLSLSLSFPLSREFSLLAPLPLSLTPFRDICTSHSLLLVRFGPEDRRQIDRTIFLEVFLGDDHPATSREIALRTPDSNEEKNSGRSNALSREGHGEKSKRLRGKRMTTTTTTTAATTMAMA